MTYGHVSCKRHVCVMLMIFMCCTGACSACLHARKRPGVRTDNSIGVEGAKAVVAALPGSSVPTIGLTGELRIALSHWLAFLCGGATLLT